MISPIKWIEPILPSSKEENKLVLLKYQDPFTKYAIFESAYLEAFWFRLRILALFNGLLNGFPYQSLFKQCPILELQACSYYLNICLGQLNIALIM